MTSHLNIGVVMDPIESITYYKDTTLALLLAAQKCGHTLVYMEINDLFIDNGRAMANAAPLTVRADEKDWFELQPRNRVDLGTLDAVLMRKDPPFDNQYIYATYILELAEREGVLIINKPQSLRDCNEKIFATRFPQCCPPLMVSRNSRDLRDFHRQHQDVIFKPLDGMGGAGIFRCRADDPNVSVAGIFRCRADDPNVSVILETLTEHGSSFIMAQKFIPAIAKGDKRILVVNGEAVPYCLARIPAEGETRGNLAAGGSGVAQPLSDRDKWIVSQVAPVLVEKGLMFVGLDVIGDYLTEINVTSPTCVREIDKAYNTDIGAKLIQAIETKIANH